MHEGGEIIGHAEVSHQVRGNLFELVSKARVHIFLVDMHVKVSVWPVVLVVPAQSTCQQADHAVELG